jgi:hypothetical protein
MSSTQRYQIDNSSTLFIGMDMMWMNTLGNQLNTYWMPWKNWKKIINNIQTSPKPTPLVQLVEKKKNDVMNITFMWRMEFIHMEFIHDS